MEDHQPDLHPAALGEQELLRDCDVTTTRRRGPGGQHRNKTDTAVVVEHRPTGIRGEASERRSQQENRRMAVFRLRLRLALGVRLKRPSTYQPLELWQQRLHGGVLKLNSQHADFPAMLADALDVLEAEQGDLARSAGRLGCSSSQLVKLLKMAPPAFESLNLKRQESGLKRLR